jgi:hypothetical protein
MGMNMKPSIKSTYNGHGVTHDISTLSEREKMRRLALFMVEDQRQPAIDGQADDVTEQGMEHGDSDDITPASQPSPTE